MSDRAGQLSPRVWSRIRPNSGWVLTTSTGVSTILANNIMEVLSHARNCPLTVRTATGWT